MKARNTGQAFRAFTTIHGTTTLGATVSHREDHPSHKKPSTHPTSPDNQSMVKPMLPEQNTQRTPPTTTDNGQSPSAVTIDDLWARILRYAELGMTDWAGESPRTLATLILHYHQLQSAGWPAPSAHVQPIPEVIDVPTGDLL